MVSVELIRKAKDMKYRCVTCTKVFATESKFQNHTCAKVAEELSLEQLMALYNAQRKTK
jgi:DNA-directed RNA polymerase subunit RPC12/RpoP